MTLLFRSLSLTHCFSPHDATVGQSHLITEASRSNSDIPHSVGLLCTSDQPDRETSTWQHTTVTTGRYQCPQRDSNPQFQQTNFRRPTPYTVRPLGSLPLVVWFIYRRFLRTYCLQLLPSRWKQHVPLKPLYHSNKTTKRHIQKNIKF